MIAFYLLLSLICLNKVDVYGEENNCKKEVDHNLYLPILENIKDYSVYVVCEKNIPVKLVCDDDLRFPLSAKKYDANLETSIGKLISLRYISISSQNINDKNFCNICNNTLEEINIGSGCISDITAYYLYKNMSNLKVFCVSHSHLTLVGLNYLCQIPTIERIDICSPELYNQFIGKQEHYKKKIS